MKRSWLLTCSCSWSRECISRWAAESMAKLHPKLSAPGIEHTIRIEEPPAAAPPGTQLPLTSRYTPAGTFGSRSYCRRKYTGPQHSLARAVGRAKRSECSRILRSRLGGAEP